MPEWFSGRFLEILGVLLSIIYLILSIRQNILLWPIGILSAIIYMVVFYTSKFYADMGLNGYYFIVSIYGWVNWSSSSKNKGSRHLLVTNIGVERFFVLLFTAALFFVAIGYVLDNFTDSPIPYWDALTTSGSMIATWMLTKKILQHWLVWIFVDLISMGLYIYRGLYPTAILFVIYSTMAIVGYMQWKRSKLLEDVCHE